MSPLGEMPLIDTPFDRVAIDLIGPLHPTSEEGHKYILTLVDYATRYPEAIPIKDKTTETVADALVGIFSRVGLPREILSDQGCQFTSSLMEEVSKLLSARQIFTSPYHPQCNGLCEAYNKTLKMMLRRLTVEQPRKWHKLIDPLLFSYREVPQSTTGFSPFELIYGRPVRGPLTVLKDLWTEQEENQKQNVYEYVTTLRNHLEETMKIAEENIDESHKKSKVYYDRKARDKKLKVGEEVLVLLPTTKNKLKVQWKGPFRIISQPHKYNYRVKMNSKIKTFHANMLKRYSRRERSDENEDELLSKTLSCNAIILQDEDETELKLYERTLKRSSVEDVEVNDSLKKEEIYESTSLKSNESTYLDQPHPIYRREKVHNKLKKSETKLDEHKDI